MKRTLAVLATGAVALALAAPAANAAPEAPERPPNPAAAASTSGPRPLRVGTPTTLVKDKLPGDGTFVSFNGSVGRMVGAAMIPVYSWAPFGGPQKVVAVDMNLFTLLRPYPVDGTFVISIQEGRVYRFVGGAPTVVTSWDHVGGKPSRVPVKVDAVGLTGVGSEACQARLRYGDYCGRTAFPTVESCYEQRLESVCDYRPRLFVRGGQDGRVYRIIGGAPVYVSSWTPFGGPQPTITVDALALDRAGEAGPFRFVRRYPADNTYVQDPVLGQVFVIIGGAPVYIDDPALLRGDSGQIVRYPGAVDGAAITRAGQAGPWAHLRYRPADGVALLTHPDGRSYWIHQGAPVPLALSPGSSTGVPTAVVGQRAVERAGEAGPWSHLASAGS